MSGPKSSTCTRLSEVMDVSHDSANRFLLRESYGPEDLFNEAKQLLNLVGGTPDVDDSTLEVQVQKLDIPDDGMLVWLRDFGNVKLFRTRLKDQLRHYVLSLPEADAYDAFKQAHFQALHDQHWRIGQYHRMIKQVCNIEKFPPQGWSMDSTRQSADTQPPLRRPLWLCPPATDAVY